MMEYIEKLQAEQDELKTLCNEIYERVVSNALSQFKIEDLKEKMEKKKVAGNA